jgi:hypothetical protein
MPLIRNLPPNQGALSRLLSTLILLAVVAVSLLLGTVLFFVVLGLLILLFMVFYARFWWLRRRFKARPPGRPADSVTLEGEYTVEKPSKDREGEGR